MAITNIGNRLSQQFLLNILRGNIDEAQRQSSTGKKSSTIAGMGSNAASASISYRNKNNLIDAYTNNLNIAKTRFEVTDKALSSVTQTTRDLISQLRSQLQSTTPQATILSDNAKAQIKVIADKLNTQVDGQYVFSGLSSTSSSFGDMGDLLTNVGTVVGAALTNPATTSASVVTDVQGLLKADLGFTNAAIHSGNVSFRADDTTTLSYPVKGGADGFVDIMRGMAIIANLPQPTTAQEQNNYWDMVNSAITLMENGAVAVDTYQAQMGGQAKIVDNLIASHRDTQTTIETYIGEIEDIDMAEAALKFANLKTQLETSYNVIATMKDLSLINYL